MAQSHCASAFRQGPKKTLGYITFSAQVHIFLHKDLSVDLFQPSLFRNILTNSFFKDTALSLPSFRCLSFSPSRKQCNSLTRLAMQGKGNPELKCRSGGLVDRDGVCPGQEHKSRWPPAPTAPPDQVYHGHGPHGHSPPPVSTPRVYPPSASALELWW